MTYGGAAVPRSSTAALPHPAAGRGPSDFQWRAASMARNGMASATKARAPNLTVIAVPPSTAAR
jgi:hypothetical protein